MGTPKRTFGRNVTTDHELFARRQAQIRKQAKSGRNALAYNIFSTVGVALFAGLIFLLMWSGAFNW